LIDHWTGRRHHPRRGRPGLPAGRWLPPRRGHLDRRGHGADPTL